MGAEESRRLGLGSAAEEVEEGFGGFVGVGGFEVWGEAAGGGFGGIGAEGLAEDVVGDVGIAGADEEVVGGLGVEEGFGVAEGGDGVDVEAVLGEDGADEGAEIG